jgi:DNA-binding winged helix-turn-helix (wHTH) protein/predicted ATPase
VGREKRITADPFRLDSTNECLWRGSQAIKLRPKAFAVLTYLSERPGQLVTKEELLSAVWPETFVTEAVLKVSIRQLREALEDDPKSPRFIETAHRRGYRYLGRIGEDGHMLLDDQEIRSSRAGFSLSLHTEDAPSKVVGRNEPLSLMQTWYQKMRRGERQIVFVTGEAGIGKTSLVDAFARSIAADSSVRICRGQCLEQYGTSEAYLPMLEAIGRLCRGQREVVEVLRTHAPMWLLQMPSLIGVGDREQLNREALGATRERMLREMGDALEALTADMSLVLILEDLHWSDYSTVDLISYLARQRQPGQIMVIGTYRTTELIVSNHRLKAVKQELLGKHQCEELPLEFLTEDAVAEYLSVRFPDSRFPAGLARLIHDRTDGNPLFMVNVVDYLVKERFILERGDQWELVVEIDKAEVRVPDSIKQMIERQIDHLEINDRRTLESASVAGAEFSVDAVMAGLGEDRALVEGRCDGLSRQRQFIRDCGVHVLPNGEAVGRYGFIHALYQNVLYDGLSVSKRAQLHRRIGEGGEQVYGERAREISTELAWHFEQGRDYKSAAKYFQQAADNAIRRFAYREAVSLSRKGLEMLESVPDSRARAEQELCLQLTLGVPLIATQGYASPDVGSLYLKARNLCQQLGDTPDVSEVLWGLWTYYVLRAELSTAHDLGKEFLRLAERLPYPGIEMRAHLVMQITLMHLGDFAPALERFEKSLSLYDPERHIDDAFLYAQNPGVAMRCFAAWTLWFLGYPDQAMIRMEEALKLARELSEPHGLAHSGLFAAFLHQLRREPEMSRQYAEAVLAVSKEHGLVMYAAQATLLRGWTLTEQGRLEEGLKQMRQGFVDYNATGTELLRPQTLSLMAEALGKARQTEEGLRRLEEALELAKSNGDASYLAEIYRVKGELLMTRFTSEPLSQAAPRGKSMEVVPSAVAQAEASFYQSIKIARQQKAKSFELRAAISLARLYQKRADESKGRRLLAEIYESFNEGFDTVDLRKAKELLNALAVG